jgi:hypothetical protein
MPGTATLIVLDYDQIISGWQSPSKLRPALS